MTGEISIFKTKLASNTGVDIGDVDVLSIAAGTNLIGKVGIDQATANANEVVIKSGTVTAVTGITNALPAGANRIGTVSGVLKTVSVTKALVAATAYHATDVLSEATSVATTSWLFAAIGRANGASGYITKAQVISETTALTPRLVLYLFNATPTCQLQDHATNTCPLFADEANYVGKIEFPIMSETGVAASHTIATPSTYGNLPLEFDCAAAADDLYGVLITLDAFTQGVGDDMVVKLTAEQY